MYKNTFMKITAICLTGMFLATGCTPAPSQPATSSNEAPVSASKKTQYPLTLNVYDAEGKTIEMTFDSAPEKVISTQLSMTELLINLGLEDKIIGVLDNANKVEGELGDKIAKLNSLGDKMTVSKEAIIATEPDLILGKGPLMFADSSIGTVASYKDLGISVYTAIASAPIDQSLDNIIQDVKNIGMIFDVQEQASKYAAKLQSQLDDVSSKIKKKSTDKPLKALLMAGYQDGTFVAFSSKLHTKMFEAINAENVISEGGVGLTMETLISLNPDAIIYITADRYAKTDTTAVNDLLANETIQEVPAIANKKVIIAKYDDIMDYGTRIITSVDSLYKGLYP